MDDLELEERIADLEGTAVHNCLSGGRSFPSYLQWSLAGLLIEKYECNIINVAGGVFTVQCKMVTVDTDNNIGLTKAICLAIIEAHKKPLSK